MIELHSTICRYRDAVRRQTDEQMEKIEGAVNSLLRIDPALSPELAYEQLALLAGATERLCLSLRQALRSLHRGLEDEGLEPRYRPVTALPGVRVDKVGGMYRIQMDGMLPFAIKGGAHYLHEALDHALEQYLFDHRLPHPVFTRPCAVVFLHHYDGDHIRRRHLRDFDNLERRCVLNVIARYFLVDDAPDNYVSMDLLVPGDRTCTEVRVMSIQSLRDFIRSEQFGVPQANGTGR